MTPEHRRMVEGMAWRGLQVFVSALLVTTSAAEFVHRIGTIEFWQEVVGSALIAVVSQLLAYAAYHMCERRPPGGPEALPALRLDGSPVCL